MAEKTDKNVTVQAAVAVVEGGTYHPRGSEFDLPENRLAAHGKDVVKVPADARLGGQDAPRGDNEPATGPGAEKQVEGAPDKQFRGGRKK